MDSVLVYVSIFEIILFIRLLVPHAPPVFLETDLAWKNVGVVLPDFIKELLVLRLVLNVVVVSSPRRVL